MKRRSFFRSLAAAVIAVPLARMLGADILRSIPVVAVEEFSGAHPWDAMWHWIEDTPQLPTVIVDPFSLASGKPRIIAK